MTGQMLAQIIAELTVCAVHPPPGTFYFFAALVRQYTYLSRLNQCNSNEFAVTTVCPQKKQSTTF